jgi:hypothetical protein
MHCPLLQVHVDPSIQLTLYSTIAGVYASSGEGASPTAALNHVHYGTTPLMSTLVDAQKDPLAVQVCTVHCTLSASGANPPDHLT